MAFRSVVHLSNPAYFQAITREIASCSEFNGGMTLLHAVARCNPPLDIVAKMIKLCPEQPAVKDCLGRTALHVAAGSAAAPKVIKLIAHACPNSCYSTDVDGKTPLHFACNVTCKLFEGESDSSPAAPRKVCHDTILALLSESIHASTIEDIDEMNALEYAIMSDAELKTVKLLQKASSTSFESESKIQPSIQPSIESLSLSPMRTATPPLRVSFEGNEIMLEGSRVPYV